MIGTRGGSAERPALFFRDAEEFRAWLEEHHETEAELWMGLHKKHVLARGLTWEQAVPEALCFGWIDSVSQRIDDDSRRQRWSPRRKGSIWSAVNLAMAEQLISEGRMRPAGLAAYERRRADRQAIYSYEQAESLTLPGDFDARLRSDPRAAAWFDAAPASYRKVCIHWVLSAKQEKTRSKRLEQLVADSASHRLIPSQRYGTEPAWVRRNQQQLT